VLGWPTHYGRTGVAALVGRLDAGAPTLLGSPHAAERGRPVMPLLEPQDLAARGWVRLAAQ
jgi:hypothetical protein